MVVPAVQAKEVGVRTIERLAPYNCACGALHPTCAIQLEGVEVGAMLVRVLVRGCNSCGRRMAKLSCGAACPDGIAHRHQIGNVWRNLTPEQRDVLFKEWRWPFPIYGEEPAELGAGI